MACRERLGVDWTPKIAMKSLYILVTFVLLTAQGSDGRNYFGKRIGRLSELEHGVKGEVYAVDSRTIHIRGFSYDGAAPDAFFYAGTSGNEPHDQGIIIPDENGNTEPLKGYSNKDVTLTLPDGLTFKDILWISVWCRAYTINFGHVMVPRNFDYPRPQKIEPLPTFDHGVSSDRIVVVDAQTFLIPNFHYDGAAPDAFFWVGKGSKPEPAGTIVPDENGSTEPLKKYTGKTIVITLPGDMTVFDVDHLGVWCRAFYANFGHVMLPKTLNVPPSLKMLGVAPQTKLNCEVLYDDLAFEVRWAVAGDSIVMQLVGKVENGEYLAFGLSGSETRSVMVGGDVTVAWLDQVTGKGEAIDYNLNAKSQCQGSSGSCPDSKVQGGSNNVRLLNAAFINDFTMLTFQRPLRASDNSDKSISTERPQAVIWAIGPVNSQGDTSYHRLRLTGDMIVDFGRTPKWNCPLPDQQESRSAQGNTRSSGAVAPATTKPVAQPWDIPAIPCYEPEDGIFYAQIGPTGGERGYNAITGHVGWGISWYINGLLIPEINVVRGKAYTFVVEGGSDPKSPAKYHPFYITDDPEGGYEFKTKAERASVKVFAGVEETPDGNVAPTAFGRLCEWRQNPDQPADSFGSFGAFQRSLTLDCQQGQPGILQWTPDQNTPNTVYYQCFTHRYLGWKINVVDSCEGSPIGSQSTQTPNLRGSRADYDYYTYDDYSDTTTSDVTIGGSTRFETRLPPRRKPSRFTTQDHYDDYEGSSNNELGFDSLPFDLPENPPRRASLPSNDIPQRHKPFRTPLRGPIINPDFKFPSLPPLAIAKNIPNATAFSDFKRLPVRNAPKGFEEESSFRKEASETSFQDTGINKAEKTATIRKGIRTRRPFKTSLGYQSPPRPKVPKKEPKRRPTVRPSNIIHRTTKANLVTSYYLGSDKFPRTTTTELPPFKRRVTYQTISRGQSAETPSFTTPIPLVTPSIKLRSPKPSFELRLNPTEKPIVMAKPFDFGDFADSQNIALRNHNLDKRFPHSHKIDQGIYHESRNQLDSFDDQERPSNKVEVKKPLYKQFKLNGENRGRGELDTETGLPYARNNGFDPTSIVYESDFRPVNNEHKIDQNIAFQVSSSVSYVDSKPKNPTFMQPPKAIPVPPRRLNFGNFNNQFKKPVRVSLKPKPKTEEGTSGGNTFPQPLRGILESQKTYSPNSLNRGNQKRKFERPPSAFSDFEIHMKALTSTTSKPIQPSERQDGFPPQEQNFEIYDAPYAEPEIITHPDYDTSGHFSIDRNDYDPSVSAKTPEQLNDSSENTISHNAPIDNPIHQKTPNDDSIHQKEAPNNNPVRHNTPVENPIDREAPHVNPIRPSAPVRVESSIDHKVPIENSIHPHIHVQNPMNHNSPSSGMPMHHNAHVESHTRHNVPIENHVHHNNHVQNPIHHNTRIENQVHRVNSHFNVQRNDFHNRRHDNVPSSHINPYYNVDRQDYHHPMAIRAPLPAFKLRPPPPPPNSPYKRFARQMRFFSKPGEESSRTRITTSNIDPIPSETLSYLTIFPKVPPSSGQFKKGQLLTSYRIPNNKDQVDVKPKAKEESSVRRAELFHRRVNKGERRDNSQQPGISRTDDVPYEKPNAQASEWVPRVSSKGNDVPALSNSGESPDESLGENNEHEMDIMEQSGSYGIKRVVANFEDPNMKGNVNNFRPINVLIDSSNPSFKILSKDTEMKRGFSTTTQNSNSFDSNENSRAAYEHTKSVVRSSKPVATVEGFGNGDRMSQDNENPKNYTNSYHVLSSRGRESYESRSSAEFSPAKESSTKVLSESENTETKIEEAMDSLEDVSDNSNMQSSYGKISMEYAKASKNNYSKVADHAEMDFDNPSTERVITRDSNEEQLKIVEKDSHPFVDTSSYKPKPVPESFAPSVAPKEQFSALKEHPRLEENLEAKESKPKSVAAIAEGFRIKNDTSSDSHSLDLQNKNATSPSKSVAAVSEEFISRPPIESNLEFNHKDLVNPAEKVDPSSEEELQKPTTTTTVTPPNISVELEHNVTMKMTPDTYQPSVDLKAGPSLGADTISKLVKPPKFDYKKSSEQISKSQLKSTHLTILKDIWDNLTDESIHM